MQQTLLTDCFGSFSDSQVSTAQFGQKLKSIVQ